MAVLAVERRLLLDGGSSLGALRWLVLSGFVQHQVETTGKRSGERRFEEVAGLSFQERSCFLLTETGQALARQLNSEEKEAAARRRTTAEEGNQTARQRRQKPSWKEDEGRLWGRGQLLHVFPEQAVILRQLLTAFENVKWRRAWLADPLPPAKNATARKRLENAVRGLNDCQKPHLLLFRTLHGGTAISWKGLDS